MACMLWDCLLGFVSRRIGLDSSLGVKISHEDRHDKQVSSSGLVLNQRETLQWSLDISGFLTFLVKPKTDNSGVSFFPFSLPLLSLPACLLFLFSLFCHALSFSLFFSFSPFLSFLGWLQCQVHSHRIFRLALMHQEVFWNSSTLLLKDLL